MRRWRRFAVPSLVALVTTTTTSTVDAQAPFGPMPGTFEYLADGLGETNTIEQYLFGGSFGWFATRNFQFGVRGQFNRISLQGFDYNPPKFEDRRLRQEVALGAVILEDETINLWTVGAFGNLLLPSSTRSFAGYIGGFVNRSGGTDLDGATDYGVQGGVKLWATRDWNVDIGAAAGWSDAYDDETRVYLWTAIMPVGGGGMRGSHADSLGYGFSQGRTHVNGRLTALVNPETIVDLSGFLGHFLSREFQLGGEVSLSFLDPDGGDSFTTTQLVGVGNYYFWRSETMRPFYLYGGLNAGVQKSTDVDAFFSYGGQVGARWQWTKHVAPFLEFRFTNYTEDFAKAQWRGMIGHMVVIPD